MLNQGQKNIIGKLPSDGSWARMIKPHSASIQALIKRGYVEACHLDIPDILPQDAITAGVLLSVKMRKKDGSINSFGDYFRLTELNEEIDNEIKALQNRLDLLIKIKEKRS